jgi:hypothetical protein
MVTVAGLKVVDVVVCKVIKFSISASVLIHDQFIAKLKILHHFGSAAMG